ncbi:MAG: hypothetical protein U0228_39685 [Myxococcaceae bacterium]
MIALVLALTLSQADGGVAAEAVPAPDAFRTQWDRERTTVNGGGMWVLGGWAALNIGSGIIGAAVTPNEQWRFFHLGNAVWNGVNLALAIVGLINNYREKPGVSAKEALIGSQRSVAVFFINAGLDVAYLATAAFLWQRGDATGDARLVGLGQSLLVQGGWLLVFDTVMGALNLSLTNRLLDHVTVTPLGVSGSF